GPLIAIAAQAAAVSNAKPARVNLRFMALARIASSDLNPEQLALRAASRKQECVGAISRQVCTQDPSNVKMPDMLSAKSTFRRGTSRQGANPAGTWRSGRLSNSRRQAILPILCA